MKKSFHIFLIFNLFHMLSAQEFNDLGSIKIDNFHRVDQDIFRSGQPDKSNFKELEKAGIKEVLNLRNHHTDDDEAKGTAIKISLVKMNAGSITEVELLKAIQIIENREGPILIHCWHGSDRTGAVVALYRIIYQDWTKEKAIDELVNDEYGHHKWYYKNIPKLIQNIDIDNFKQRLKIKK